MPHIRNRVLLYGLLAGLALFLVYRGILPALTRVDSDFPNYYTAAKIVADGKDRSRLYDDQWFQDQIHFYGMEMKGKFSPFPPATALVLLPLTALDPLTALRITVVINLVLLALSIRFLAALFSIPVAESGVFALLSGIGLANCFRLGQLYILLSFLIIAGYFAYTRNNKILAGICLGVFVPIKYYPIVILAYFAVKSEWRTVISGVVTAALVGIAGILILGWDVHKKYISSVLGSHLASHLTLQNPFSSTFQSWDSLLHRLFVLDPILNPHPLFMAQEMFPIVKIGILLLQLVIGLAAIVRVHLAQEGDTDAFSIGLLGLLALLLAPATGTYHYVLLWLPVGLLFTYFMRSKRAHTAYAILVTYAVLGFIPYSMVQQFDGHGALTILAYPRLALLLAMFLLTVQVVWNRNTQKNVEK